MDKLKENLKEIIKCNTKTHKLNTRLEELKKAYWLFCDKMRAEDLKSEISKQNYIDFSTKIDEIETEKTKLNNKMQKIAIEKAFLENNMYLILQDEVLKIFLVELDKYKNKNIGEKTHAKIQDAVMAQLDANHQGYFFQFWYSLEAFISTKTYRLHLRICTNKTLAHNDWRGDYWNFSGHVSEFEMTIDSRPEGLHPYLSKYDYIEINDIEKKAQELTKEREKVLISLQKANDKRCQYNERLNNKLHNLLYIEIKNY